MTKAPTWMHANPHEVLLILDWQTPQHSGEVLCLGTRAFMFQPGLGRHAAVALLATGVRRSTVEQSIYTTGTVRNAMNSLYQGNVTLTPYA